MSKKDLNNNPAMQFLQGIANEEPKTEFAELPKKEFNTEKAIEQGIDPTQFERLTELRNKRIQLVVKPSLFEALENFKYDHRERSVNDIINKAIIEYINNRGANYND